MRALPLFALALFACKDGPTDDTSVPTDDSAVSVDEDGDGVPADQDCDDTNPAIYPAADEVCDGLDNNCDGFVDEDALDASTFYPDGDGDGYGVDAGARAACEAPTGYVEVGGDCNDTDTAYHPGATEDDCADANDYNCDGSVGFEDNDGDGYAACEECDDGDRAVNPSATEVCDDVDNNCDGEIDAGAVDADTWYQDVDGDGFGDGDFTTESCERPTGYADNPDDCDDGAPGIHPDADELCNSLDDDCDGDTDEDDAVDAPTWYIDYDGDSYGSDAFTTEACSQPAGYVGNSDDCDDTEALAWTGAAEACDEVDNDCDSTVDEGVTTTWYADGDGDSYGSSSLTAEACSQPTGYVADASDCDDGDADIHPGATEVCDGEDNDCDGDFDDDDAGLDTSTASTWYADFDGDNYGDAAATTLACDQPSSYVTDDTDCDDADGNTYPGAPELCDGLDNDCDNTPDSGLLGSDALCAAESCLEILNDGSSTGDGAYYLDPTNIGTAELFDCDMTTDGGGWTHVVDWSKANGDDWSAFYAHYTLVFDDMGYTSENSSYIQWCDYQSDADAMSYTRPVDVPNGGEMIYEIYYTGSSMEESATYFWVDTPSGDYNLYCSESITLSSYNSAEQATRPYSCSASYHNSWTWSGTHQGDAGDEVTAFSLTSMMHDGGCGDNSYLYRTHLWVR
ncbi:MAG: hypothetical protein H6739_21935 [Alphaproteobacteria bacterium]|nr:hypothetical protein [Alphaproteobacteria bacterium]